MVNPSPNLEAILDAIPPAVIESDGDMIVYANAAARGLFDLPDGSPVGPLSLLAIDALRDAIAHTKSTGNGVEHTVEVHDHILQCATATLPGDTYVALVATDITGVERVREMRRDFVANASHELKTPVTGMLALAESLELAMDRDQDRARHMVGRIKHEALRLSQLVRELLDLTRLEEGALREGDLVDLRAVCLDMIARLGSVADAHQVFLRCHRREPLWVEGSRESFKTILSNLLTNAVNYNRPGGRVDVSMIHDGHTVSIIVEDTGLGIEAEHVDRIFERFYRSDPGRSRNAGGTGLGLSIVRHAVEQMGGHVQVQSSVGEGSTFTVTIPTLR